MARRQFDVIDIVEVLQHWHAGRPKSVVAHSLGIDPRQSASTWRRRWRPGWGPGGRR